MTVIPSSKTKAENSLKNLKTLMLKLHFPEEEISEVCKTGKIVESKLQELTGHDKILLQLKLKDREKTLDE